MTNNLTVSFAAFAGGSLGGLGTLYMMVFNGVLIGVIGVACERAGMSLSLWSFVAPHGVARAAGHLHRRRRRPAAGEGAAGAGTALAARIARRIGGRWRCGWCSA